MILTALNAGFVVEYSENVDSIVCLVAKCAKINYTGL